MHINVPMLIAAWRGLNLRVSHSTRSTVYWCLQKVDYIVVRLLEEYVSGTISNIDYCY